MPAISTNAARLLLGGLIALSLTAAASAQGLLDPAKVSHREVAGGVVQWTDLTYASPRGFRPVKLDLYVPPAGGAPKPLVIWVHGGGWLAGDPRAGSQPGGPFTDWPAVLTRLAARGYVVAGVSYRLTGEARFPAQVQDVKAAVRWLKANAAAYHADAGRVVAWGASAGAHLVSLAGTSCGVAALEEPTKPGDPSSCVQAVVDWYGPIDFAQLDRLAIPKSMVHGAPDSPESLYLGCNLADCPPDLVQSANAITYVSAKSPPFLIMHGDADTSVAPEQSRLLVDALRAKGVEVEFVSVPGANHSFVRVSAADGEPLLQRVFAFIDRVTKRR
jgi:acetyl esterase/lipase